MVLDLSSLDLFDDSMIPLGSHAYLLKGYALPYLDELLPALRTVVQQAPFRKMMTPTGGMMSVGLTNCGDSGWVSDRQSYRYASSDPLSMRPWPTMPQVFKQLAQQAAADRGFLDFIPDACLINRYRVDSQMGLHQDKNEKNFDAPIVSVSLGMTAIFLWGGLRRSDPVAKVVLHHGDVVVWGGPDRLRFHGVEAIIGEKHPIFDSQRINLTFRLAN